VKKQKEPVRARVAFEGSSGRGECFVQKPAPGGGRMAMGNGKEDVEGGCVWLAR
jgi:hypothetical protein